MSSVGLVGDYCTGHGCFPPRPNVGTTQSLVDIEGVLVLTQGSPFASHKCGDSSHAGVLVAGSGFMDINGVPVGRIGDPISCGSALAEGSEFVFGD